MLPTAFLERMKRQLGDEYPEYLASLELPRAVALRFAPGKVTPLPFVEAPVPWEPLGFYYDPDSRPGLHPYHDAGVYYLQEASAMAPAALLAPQPGERILDLCAAPGGKSTQIAGYLKGEGLLFSNEIHPKRVKILSQNIERMGIPNAIVTNEHPKNLANRLPGFFHRVLVDAPCSGEGMFRKEAAAVTDWSEETVAMCAARQLEILHSAAQLLAPGGRLVYSTCTFAPQENEGVIAAFLQSHPEFSPENVQVSWFAPGENGSFRLWPHKLRGEGHFAAVLKKNTGKSWEIQELPGEKLPKEWVSFAEELGISLPDGKAVTFGQTLYWAPPETPSLKGLKVLRPGLELGEIKKERIQPAHALALWGKSCTQTVDFPAGSEQIARYLRGDVIANAKKGWCTVTADGFPLGWAKGDGTVLKNHYPKALRRQP